MSLLIKGQEHHIFGSPDTCFNSLMTWMGSGSKLASHGLLEWWRTDSWREYHYGVSTPLWNSNAPGSFFGTSSLQSGHPNRIVFLSVCMTGSSSVVFGSRGRLSQLILIVLKRPTPKIKKDLFQPQSHYLRSPLREQGAVNLFIFFFREQGILVDIFAIFLRFLAIMWCCNWSVLSWKKKLLFTNNSTLY